MFLLLAANLHWNHEFSYFFLTALNLTIVHLSFLYKSLDSYELTKQILSHAILFPEERVNNNPLVITKEDDYDKLNDKIWTSIIGNEHGNSPRIDIVMNDYPHIQFINIGSNSLMNITSLTISNLPELRVFIADYHSFYNTSSLTLSSILLK